MDELHTIVGAGAAEGAVDAANLLKPMLARGELRAVGATTLDEYRKHIEKDAALERRFQPVYGRRADRRGHDRDPARPQGALRGPPRRPHPGRRADRRGDALRTATSPTASCPTRRSTSSTRPPRALRIEIDSLPDEIDEVERRIMQLEIELASLEREKDDSVRRAPRGDRARAGRPARAVRRHEGPVAGARRSRSPGVGELKERLEQARPRARARRARGRPPARRRAAPRRDPRARARARRGAEARGRDAHERRVPPGGGRRRGHRRGRGALDRHPGLAADGGRGREAHPHGGAPAPARHRPGRGRRGRLERAAPLTRRAAATPTARSARSSSSARPASARPSWRARSPSSCSTRQDAMVRIDMSRVHGEALRVAARRRASRLRRLRGGRPAHRGGAPPARTPSSCSTRSRRPTPTSSTSCCR